MKLEYNKYQIYARLLPTILSVIPFLIIQYSLFDDSLQTLFNEIGGIKIIGNITVTGSIIYLLSQINRHFGKHIFEKYYFSKSLNFPTTYYLLHNDTSLSAEYKRKIHDKIFNDFSIKFNDEEIEKSNESESRKIIRDAVGLVRRKVGDGKLTIQHNLEYGFFRNLIGGAILASIVSAILTYWSFKVGVNNLVIIGSILTLIYLIFIILSKPILKSKARLYADMLFQEYIEQ